MRTSVYIDFTPEQRVYFLDDEGMGDLVVRLGRIARIRVELIKGEQTAVYEVASSSGSVYTPPTEDIFSDQAYAADDVCRRLRVRFDEYEEAQQADAVVAVAVGENELRRAEEREKKPIPDPVKPDDQRQASITFDKEKRALSDEDELKYLSGFDGN